MTQWQIFGEFSRKFTENLTLLLVQMHSCHICHCAYRQTVSDNKLFNYQNLIMVTIKEKIEKAKEKKLKSIDLRAMDLAVFPMELLGLKQIEEIDISDNMIRKIPEEILSLPKLTKLIVQNNPLVSPPLEIANQGFQALKNYFKQLNEEGAVLLNEAKLLIVGEGGVGKTTFARKLMDDNSPMPQENESTKGIDVLNFTFLTKKEQQFKLNIWDFGGQEIYHSTHQFFLSKRSLYVLVADTRKENTNFFYWLNLVKILSDNSPVIIIINEKSDRAMDFDEFAIKSKFTNIVRILKGNLLTNRGLSHIVDEVKHQVQQLPHIGNTIPKAWNLIKNNLQHLNKNYILSDNYLMICKEKGIKDTSQALILSQYLHDLGIFLHFQDNPILKRMISLNPEWATKAVYKIIESNEVIANNGIFTRLDIQSIWRGTEYTQLADELLELMKKFELCYEINDNKFIVPQLLPYEAPKYKYDYKNSITLRYKYDFMPKGILTRFIVRMNRYVKDDVVWKTGVLLQREDAIVEIKEYYQENEINVKISGEGKQDFLILLTEEFNQIHDTFHNLKVERLIPCNCSECTKLAKPHYYDYSSLIRRMKKSKLTVECEISFEDISVKSLISDIGLTKQEENDIFNSVLKNFGLNSNQIKGIQDEK